MKLPNRSQWTNETVSAKSLKLTGNSSDHPFCASCTHPHHGETRRNAYDAAFKLKAISLAVEEGNRAASRTFGINESMVRRWRRQHEQLTRCKKTTKAFRGKKSRWPELDNVLEDWVNTQRADGRGVSTVQIRLKAKTIATEQNIEDFGGGPSWCFRFMQRKGLSIRARTTVSAAPSLHSKKDSRKFHWTRRHHKYG